MIVTRIAYSKNITASKLAALEEIASRLGRMRTEVWDKYGSLQGVRTNHRAVRDSWLASKREFDVPARLWKETLRDVFADIELYRAAAIAKAKGAVYRRTSDEETRRKLWSSLQDGTWINDSYLRRVMRKHFKHGHTQVKNQIILDSQCYKWFQHGGKCWIEVTSLIPRQRIAIPLNTTYPIKGTIRLLLRNGRVEVHYTVEPSKCGCNTSPCGQAIIGIDKGYTEAFVDSDGEAHGEGLGEILIAESDYLKVKYQNRQKIEAIAKKSNKSKRHRIKLNNLGRKKLERRRIKHTAKVKTKIYQGTHSVLDKAFEIVCEDLAVPIKAKKNRGKNTNRRLSGWVKGLMADALEQVSPRRGASVVLVNAAYTSQACSCCGSLGDRQGDAFYCTECRVVLHADMNAARNVLARLNDPEISRWTPYQKVKSILLERQRRRPRLSSQDSSCTGQPVSTESEKPSSKPNNA